MPIAVKAKVVMQMARTRNSAMARGLNCCLDITTSLGFQALIGRRCDGAAGVLVRRESDRQIQLISSHALRTADGSSGQLQDRMRGEAGRDAPGGHVAPKFANPMLSVHVDEIDWELHAE